MTKRNVIAGACAAMEGEGGIIANLKIGCISYLFLSNLEWVILLCARLLCILPQHFIFVLCYVVNSTLRPLTIVLRTSLNSVFGVLILVELAVNFPLQIIFIVTALLC